MTPHTTLRRLLAAVLVLAVVAGPVQAQEQSEAPSKTIVEIAQGNDNFSTLVTALKAADLVGALQGEGPFTVFAPTNAAFDKLPDGQLKSLLKEENKAKLQAILKYHVVPAKAPASKVAGMSEAKTLQGKMVSVNAGDDGVTLTGQNSASVTSTDIMASNGVIHVIDTVLLPPEGEEMEKDGK
jgi:uncharacterized surface protein with fasciclin (FAS1) repeats